MNRVLQRTSEDCFRCCIAMVTGIPYEEVPDFVARYGEWWGRAAQAWLDHRDMGLVCLGQGPLDFVPKWLPVIALGPGPRGGNHCVVVCADRVIDPHPDNLGITAAERLYLIVHRPTVDPAHMPPPSERKRRAPWPDFAGQSIHEGDVIRHPSGESGRVVFLSEHEDPSDQWRVDYGNGEGALSRLCLQIGDKGCAVVDSRTVRIAKRRSACL